jgi:hypothetical protein
MYGGGSPLLVPLSFVCKLQQIKRVAVLATPPDPIPIPEKQRRRERITAHRERARLRFLHRRRHLEEGYRSN